MAASGLGSQQPRPPYSTTSATSSTGTNLLAKGQALYLCRLLLVFAAWSFRNMSTTQQSFWRDAEPHSSYTGRRSAALFAGVTQYLSASVILGELSR